MIDAEVYDRTEPFHWTWHEDFTKVGIFTCPHGDRFITVVEYANEFTCKTCEKELECKKEKPPVPVVKPPPPPPPADPEPVPEEKIRHGPWVDRE